MKRIAGSIAFTVARNLQMARRLLHHRSRAVQSARRHRAAFYDQAWKDAAAAVGAQCRALDPSLWEIYRGSHRTFVYLNYTNLDDPVTLKVAGNKAVAYELVRAAGLPVPPHRRFDLDTIDAAMRFLAEISGPCVVKPLRDTGAGQGVTTGIRERRHLITAIACAASYQQDLLIEKQLPGHNYRLLYLDGELLDVVRRDRPAIVGDGRSTVRALVAALNAERLARGFAAAQSVVLHDREMAHTLSQQGLGLRSVPAAGRTVWLKTVVNDNQASENWEARNELCDDLVIAGARAAQAVGVRLAGVDIITPDASVPLEANGGAVLEVNTTPGFHLHYHRVGAPFPVATAVLEHLLEEPQREVPGTIDRARAR